MKYRLDGETPNLNISNYLQVYIPFGQRVNEGQNKVIGVHGQVRLIRVNDWVTLVTQLPLCPNPQNYPLKYSVLGVGGSKWN